jgi:hypothetical protein
MRKLVEIVVEIAGCQFARVTRRVSVCACGCACFLLNDPHAALARVTDGWATRLLRDRRTALMGGKRASS